jgi:hypothetical protein
MNRSVTLWNELLYPVSVEMILNKLLSLCRGQIFCTAQSIITVKSPECVDIVESGEVGIGQLFRYLDRLPTFSLLDAGRMENGCLWRKYILSSSELSCLIHEVFCISPWDITVN